MKLILPAATVDLDAGEVHRADQVIGLTRLEANLLAYLAARPGVAVDKEELLSEVWDYRPGLKTRAVDALVLRLRRKLEAEPDTPECLKTVYGRGYRLDLGDVDASYGAYVVEQTLVTSPTLSLHRASSSLGPAALLTGDQGIVDQVGRAHELLDHPRIPPVMGEGSGWLALGCAVRETMDEVWQRIDGSDPFPFSAGTWLAHELVHATIHAHAHGLTMGTFSWNCVWVDDAGEPWFVGWDRTLGPALGEVALTNVVEAPELAWSQTPTTKSDVWGLLSLFESIPARVRPRQEALVRLYSGEWSQQDQAVADLLLPLRAQIMAPAPQRLGDLEDLLRRYHRVWSLLGTEPDYAAWLAAVGAGL